jgi:hypothetical protein
MAVVSADGEEVPSRYRVIAPLGRGAFAVAYHCEDTETAEHVVVKLYELRDRAWSLLTSFEREAAVLAELSHPAIPRYLAHSQLPGGRLMLVQSYAAGRSLAELLREGKRFTDDEVADLAEQVLGVLEYLQSLNPPIVHRDIKPGNLVLNEARLVQLVDFGSVKAGFRRDSELGSTIVGTYGYMAPEQFQGRATIQSDLFGLGATLVHLLSHVAPADLPQDGLRLDFHDSVKASTGTIAWLDRVLEPDPHQRFANARQALDAFRQRDAIAVMPAAMLATTGISPPEGSQIVVDERDGELSLTIPGSGFRRPGVTGFAGAFMLVFVLAWSIGAAQGSFPFSLVSLPIWFGGGWSLLASLVAMFENTAIRIGPERYSVEQRLFGTVRHHEGPTSDLAGAGLVRTRSRTNRQLLKKCILHAGARGIKFGSSLGVVERRWLVWLINEHLGLDADEDELDEES